MLFVQWNDVEGVVFLIVFDGQVFFEFCVFSKQNEVHATNRERTLVMEKERDNIYTGI